MSSPSSSSSPSSPSSPDAISSSPSLVVTLNGIYDDNLSTHTSREQLNVEHRVFDTLQSWHSHASTTLYRDAHIAYLLKSLSSLSEGFVSLDASRPWIVYWCVHSLTLLNYTISDTCAHSVLDWLQRCQHPKGTHTHTFSHAHTHIYIYIFLHMHVHVHT